MCTFLGGEPTRYVAHEISPTDNRKLICYGRLVTCVVAPNASQATIAQCGEKRGPEVLQAPLTR
jgi:hypothetical protein